MDSLFFSVIKEDCQEMSSSQNESGLLEVVAPKNCDDKEIIKHIMGLGTTAHDKQKNAKEAFRKKVSKMIDKYKEEFNLPFIIKLRLQTKTKKLNDCNVECHGIVFEGNLLIAAFLQYFPDELVEKIIRCTVYMMACEYEERTFELKSLTIGTLSFPDGKIESSEHFDLPEDAKYSISLEYSEIQKIKSDYELAVKQIVDGMKRKPIMSI
ncbi:MAG: hypothetical protein PHN80_02265 [Hespellia sp.]|nr:hypothetical protein [Hespellia sp.]